MTPVTSPIGHSSIKPSSGFDITTEEDNTESGIDEIEFLKYVVKINSKIQRIWKWMALIHSIQIPLTFTIGSVPEIICNHPLEIMLWTGLRIFWRHLLWLVVLIMNCYPI